MEKRPLNEVFEELDEWGEELVEQKYELGQFGAGDKERIVALWLDRKRRFRSQSDMLESKRTARSAKNAAWAAAIAATLAAIATAVMAYLAYVSPFS